MTVKTYDSVGRIDIRLFGKAGLLENGSHGVINNWPNDEYGAKSIGFHAEEDHLRLTFDFQNSNGVWEEISEDISYLYTPTNYGGTRQWFKCPGCGSRAAIVFKPERQFRCRKCYKLQYACQNDGYFKSLFKRRDKLGFRIFDDYDQGDRSRKKWMREEKFGPLYLEFMELERNIDLLWKNGVLSRYGISNSPSS